jgi:hypothetical protein
MCNAAKGTLPARAFGKRGYLILDLYQYLWPDTLLMLFYLQQSNYLKINSFISKFTMYC